MSRWFADRLRLFENNGDKDKELNISPGRQVNNPKHLSDVILTKDIIPKARDRRPVEIRGLNIDKNHSKKYGTKNKNLSGNNSKVPPPVADKPSQALLKQKGFGKHITMMDNVLENDTSKSSNLPYSNAVCQQFKVRKPKESQAAHLLHVNRQTSDSNQHEQTSEPSSFDGTGHQSPKSVPESQLSEPNKLQQPLSNETCLPKLEMTPMADNNGFVFKRIKQGSPADTEHNTDDINNLPPPDNKDMLPGRDSSHDNTTECVVNHNILPPKAEHRSVDQNCNKVNIDPNKANDRHVTFCLEGDVKKNETMSKPGQTAFNASYEIPHTQGYHPTHKDYHQELTTDCPRLETVLESTPPERVPSANKSLNRKVSLPGWDEPRLFITLQENDKLTVNEDTVHMLTDLTDMVVISIVGPYRSGKSHLMNVIADRKKAREKGFKVGHTVRAETSGIWIWCIPHPNLDNTVLALLDSEGFGDIMKGNCDRENSILLVNVLLSSTLIYNSKGVLDADAMKKLQLVAQMADKIKTESECEIYKSDNSLAMIFPLFIWVLRDFELELGSQTPDQYLESALEVKQGCGFQAATFNATRDCICRFFPGRKCLVLPPQEFPHHLEKQRELVKFILDNANVKRIGTRIIHGKGFVSLAKGITSEISSGSSQINVFQMLGRLTLEEHNNAFQRAINFFEERLMAAGWDNAFDEAGHYFMRQQCHDGRYLIDFLSYMEERKTGTRPADITVLPPSNCKDDRDYWHVLSEFINKGQVPKHYIDDFLQNVQQQLEQKIEQATVFRPHYEKERIAAEKDHRKYRKEHLDDFISKYDDKLIKENEDLRNNISEIRDVLKSYSDEKYPHLKTLNNIMQRVEDRQLQGILV